jgi:hypothetical protein
VTAKLDQMALDPARSAYARFLVFSARTGADWEGLQTVDLTRSPSRRRMTDFCVRREKAALSSG